MGLPTPTDIEHPELGRAFRYATSKWISTANSWSVGRRAPLLNEDADAVMRPPKRESPVIDAAARAPVNEAPSPRGKPFPLHGIRILDFTWFLASAGGTRFMAAFGAESIKVELKSHPDTRLAAMAPVGGREAREKATAPLPGVTDVNMGGQFNNKNPGKRGISLNVRHPKGLEIAKRVWSRCRIRRTHRSRRALPRRGQSLRVRRAPGDVVEGDRRARGRGRDLELKVGNTHLTTSPRQATLIR